MWDVAVIGAGLSGIICARRLVSAGYSVCILDKSRGVGGRMATRRVSNHVRVDHGLRYWQAKSEGLRSLTDELVAAGVLKLWTASEYEIKQLGKVTLVKDAAPKYVTQTGMSAVAKHLLQQPGPNGLPAFERDKNLLTNYRAIKISRRDELWAIECDSGEVVWAKRCAIAIPAPQAADLLESYLPCEGSSSGSPDLSQPDLSQSDLSQSDRRQSLVASLNALQSVRYLPCLTVMAGYASTYRSQMDKLDPHGWMVTDYVGTSTDWVGLDSSKCNRTDDPVVVIHSKPEFAQRYLETNDLQPAASVLLRANARRLLDWIAQPDWFQVHRWRYAQVKAGYCARALVVNESLVCGGDWCLAADEGTHEGTDESTDLSGLDNAYLSGLSLAERLQQ